MKVCMLGAGALGSTIGATLHEGGCEVTLVTRNAAHVEAINEHGLRVRTGDPRNGQGTRHLGARRDERRRLGPGRRRRGAGQGAGDEGGRGRCQGACRRRRRVRQLAERPWQRGDPRRGPRAVRCHQRNHHRGGPAHRPGPGQRRRGGQADGIGELDGTLTPRVQDIAGAFSAAGLHTSVSTDIAGLKWDKLLTNVATGALGALTRLTYTEMYAVPEIEACALAAVREAMSVARGAGVSLVVEDPGLVWRRAAEGLPGDFKTSMLQSVEAASATEIDYINGAVVRWGQRVGVPTPVNSTLVAAVKGLERSLVRPNPAQGQPWRPEGRRQR